LKRIEELGEEEKFKNIKLPINGNDIIKEFNIKKGPIIGILLDAVKEAYFEDPNITKEKCFNIIDAKLKTIV
jgi:hypothetical protein